MLNVIDLDDHRRRRAQAEPPEEARIVSKHLNDYTTLYSIVHERREVVQAAIDYLCAHVESFGSGGWGEFNKPQRQGGLYVSCGIIMRFPDA